jgi:hypothetical protein
MAAGAELALEHTRKDLLYIEGPDVAWTPGPRHRARNWRGVSGNALRGLCLEASSAEKISARLASLALLASFEKKQVKNTAPTKDAKRWQLALFEAAWHPSVGQRASRDRRENLGSRV